MKCKECRQEQPVNKRGDIVQLQDGRLGVVTAPHVYFPSVVILSGLHKGYPGIYSMKELTVVHGYFHIDRRAR